MREQVARQLAGLLEPIRDLVVGQLLREMASALENGFRVRQEPPLRDSEGRILRNGGLHLPRRGDLGVSDNGETVLRRVQSRTKLSFDPVKIETPEGFVIEVSPFRWDAARLSADVGDGSLDVTPIRRWYLEAFQSRFGELAPDLEGVVHALTGPRQVGRVCHFTCDFGSAPVETVGEMLDAFARAGARSLRVDDDHGMHEPALQS